MSLCQLKAVTADFQPQIFEFRGMSLLYVSLNDKFYLRNRVTVEAKRIISVDFKEVVRFFLQCADMIIAW